MQIYTILRDPNFVRNCRRPKQTFETDFDVQDMPAFGSKNPIPVPRFLVSL
jgi:hypothetical protein